MNRLSFLVLLALVLTINGLGAQDGSGEQVEWRHANLSMVLFDRNPDTASADHLINIYASDHSGTDFYANMTTPPVHYDFVISPWSREVYDQDLLLLEQEGKLAIADRQGKVIRQTPYHEIRKLSETDWLLGKLADGSGSEVFRLAAKAPLLSLPLENGETISFEAGYFLRSGYGHPTRIYDQQGQLVVQEMELSVTPLMTDEARFFYRNQRLFKSWIADGAGNVLVELPKSTLFVSGQGKQIKVQTGATSMYWIDLAGNRLTEPLVEPLIAGEIDILHNCGEPAKVGAYFHRTDTQLPCEYDRFAIGWQDSSLIIAKKYTSSIYFRRNGETYYDPGGPVVSRYLGDGYFVKGGREGCQFVRANGEVVAQTEIPVADPTRVAQAAFLPDSAGGKFVISPKYGGTFEAYDTQGTKLFTYEGRRFASFNWAAAGDDIKVTMGRDVFFLDRNGQELKRQRYRNPQYIYRDGELRYIITNQIYPERVDGDKGVAGLLDGVSTHLVDAQTDEVIVSSNTGMRWIDDDHLLLYFGFTYGIIKVD